MGKMLAGINGPVQGKVGALIGSSRNGVPYIKGPYKRRTKKVSKLELANREKFKLAQRWLRPVLGFVREGFKGYSERSEGFVAAKSYLLRHAMEGTAPSFSVNPSLMKLSSGDLPLSPGITVEKTGDKQNLKFSWDPGHVTGADGQDQVMVMAYDVKNETAVYYVNGQFRKTGMETIMIFPKKGKTYQVYMAFVAADRSRQSDSVYLGEMSY